MSSRVIKKVREVARRATATVKRIAEKFEFTQVRFKDGSGEIDFSIDLTQETVWATQQQLAALFGVTTNTISEHIQNIFSEGELEEEAVARKFRVTAKDGKNYNTLHYNLDAILSVGYRVNSTKATQFRQWASRTLKAYLVDGYALNERRLANDPAALRQLAADVRALRSGEIQIYQAVRDCFKLAASDYDPNAQETRTFYATVQDKFLFAVSGKTASDLILSRADGSKDNMGLSVFEGDFPTLKDATIGKNYLLSDELYTLHILCEQFLLFAESKAMRSEPMTMKQLQGKLDDLLKVNDYQTFCGYGEYQRSKALDHARRELERYKRHSVRVVRGKKKESDPARNLPNRAFRRLAPDHKGLAEKAS